MQMEQLQKDMIAAMKAKDKTRKDALSTLISAVKKLAIDEGSRDDIKEELVDRAVLKEMKLVKEQFDSCPEDRTDLKASYGATYEIMKEYAPVLMSEAEIVEYITTNFADALAQKNKGVLMKSIMAELKGKADGKLINKIVSSLCS